MELIKAFKELNKNNVTIAGGKGASLGEMAGAGIPVPPGFVVLSNAFERFIEETGIRADIDSILHKVKHEETHTVDRASEEINGIIMSEEMPKDIKTEIEREFIKLNSKYVAVRSSATSEDSASAAWAGQLDSFLNTTEKTLLENVKKCWASLFTPRAIFYRFEKNLHGTEISVAVVVQKMVDSEVSGIAFSVHPVTQNYNQLIIEAGYGLGEAIVSGQITPDSYVVEKEPRRIIDKNIAKQEKGLYKIEKGGNKWVGIDKNKGLKQKLNDKQVIELSKVIIQIEKHYKFPCDIEWAYETGKFYIVQSRPITTLTAKSDEVKRSNDLVEIYLESIKGKKLYPPLQSYSAFMLGQGFHLKKYCQKWYGKDVEFNLLILMKNGFSQIWLPEDYMKSTSQIALREYVKNKSKFQKRVDSLNKGIKRMDKMYLKYTYEELNKLNSASLLYLLKKLRDLTWNVNAPVICVNDIDKKMCWDTIKNEGFKLSREEFDNIWERASEPAFESIDKVQLKEFLNLLLRNKPWNNILEECQYFLTNYHSIKDFSIVEKSLKEQFNVFLNDNKKIKSHLDLESENLKKIINLHKQWLDTLSKNQRKFAEYLHTVMLMRDRRKSFINKGLTIIYRIAQKIFRENGIKEELIPYYTFNELLKNSKYLNKVKDSLEGRRKGFELFISYSGDIKMLNTNIDYAVEKVNSYFMKSQNKEEDKNIVQGQIGSRGLARGIVRIVFDVHSNHGFQQGEILVTGMTRPEFVPLMKKAVAIVTDEGGITCHAAIVSRELGIPCVIGTKFATRQLKSGDLIEVDANNGIVKILKKSK